MKRKTTRNFRRQGSRANLPVWLTDGINRAVDEETFDGAEMAARACILALQAGTASAVSINTIGKYIAFIRMLCLQDDKIGKNGNGHNTLCALAIQCAEIYRDALLGLKDEAMVGLDAEDIKLLNIFVDVSIDFTRRHTEHAIAYAWLTLEQTNTLQLLLGIDPQTGEHNADDGKLEQWIAEKERAAA